MRAGFSFFCFFFFFRRLEVERGQAVDKAQRKKAKLTALFETLLFSSQNGENKTKNAVAQGIDEGWWGRAGVQSGVNVSCRSRDPGDLNFLSSQGRPLFDLVLSRGGLTASSSSSSSSSSGGRGSLSDLLAGAARVLKPGSGVLVAAERVCDSGASGLVRGLTGLGGASASSLALADLERALETAPGFSKIALDVVCAGTDPHAVVVAFRDESSVFGVGVGKRAASAGTEEEDALVAALSSSSKAKRTRGGSKKGFK